ncbi:MAG: C4-dicarboxylate ABC transporter substrate-binding protein, partial [Sulfitobacter sp.]
MTHSILKTTFLAAAMALAAQASFAQVKVALDSPPDLEGSGSYVWAHTFAEHLKANGMEAEEYQRGA